MFNAKYKSVNIDKLGLKSSVSRFSKMVEETQENGQNANPVHPVSPSSFSSCSSDVFVFGSADDDEYDEEYGPGFVNRVKSKYLSRFQRADLPNKSRVGGSVDNLLSDDSVCNNVPRNNKIIRNNWNKNGGSVKFGRRLGTSPMKAKRIVENDRLKKAHSMEMLDAPMKLPIKSVKPVPRPTVRSEKSIVIIEKPNFEKQLSENTPLCKSVLYKRCNSAPVPVSIDDREMPQPDIVRTCKEIFESKKETNGALNNRLESKPKLPSKSAKVLAVVKSGKTVASSQVKPFARVTTKTPESKIFSVPPKAPDRPNGMVTRFTEALIAADSVATVVEVPKVMTNGFIRVTDTLSTKKQIQMEMETTKEQIEMSNKGAVEVELNDQNAPLNEKLICDENKIPFSIVLDQRKAETNQVSHNIPKIVDATLKMDKKPIVHIKPFTQDESADSEPVLKCMDVVSKSGCLKEGPNFPAVKLRSSRGGGSDSNTLVFDFTVDQDERELSHIRNADEDEADSGSPIDLNARIEFVGAGVISGKSMLLRSKDKKLRLKFDDSSTTTFEYPSEECVMQAYALLDEGATVAQAAQVESNGHSSAAGESAESTASIAPAKTLMNSVTINSTGGLANFTPSVLSKSGDQFELGVSWPKKSDNDDKQKAKDGTKDKGVESTADNSTDATADVDLMLKPADDGETTNWSDSATTSDLLF